MTAVTMAMVKNVDKPKYGEFPFKLKKVWEIDKVGEDYFGTIYSLVVSEDDRICLYDWKILKYYILDSSGKLLHTFGKKGEGPGEIRRLEQAPVITAADKIVVIDETLLHYFDWQGTFIKTYQNMSGNRPIIFLDEYTYITAPRSSLAAPDGKAKVEKINVKTQQREVITTFSMYRGGVLRSSQGQAAVVFGGITPVAVVTMGNDMLLYGMSDVYQINIADMNGKKINTFSLERPRGRVKEQDIVDRLVLRAKGKAPKALLERLAKTLPKEQTFFNQIRVHKGLIYVDKADFYATNTSQIDIFSFKGEYLYRGKLALEEGYDILRMRFTDKYLYAAVEDEEAENLLVKYEITYPKGK
jgi:hypothetical protein